MEQTTTKLTEKVIQNTLITLGTPTNLLGFTYLTKAIKLAYENPEYKHLVTKKLYPAVAKMENTSSIKVERAMRHAIKAAWDRGDVKNLIAVFGCTVSKENRPTNSEFISMLVLRFEQNYKRETSAKESSKSKIFSKRDQRVAVEILTKFMFTDTMDDVVKVWKQVYEEYGLCDDIFTGTPCTPDEYCKNRLEYDKQNMIEKFGHCDGLE